jgi:DNA helicase-2/ATP-dependent DNA helicase PcrA
MKEKLDYAKMILLEKGLSVTALNHFLECPNKFFYKSILKLPEPPTASSEKGTAMHEALSNVWKNLTLNASPINRRVEKGEIETIIKTSILNYFKHSLLAKNEREAVLEELLENAPKVAEALTEHFNQKGRVATEKWVENYFQHSYDSKPIEIRLHGKMDTIIEKENETLVFDYKTKEVMSEKEIKGETKNSDGNYFRQLIFYKILLLKNSHLAKPNIIPALVFVKPDSKGECPTTTLPIEPTDIERVNSEIKSLIETVWSNQLLSKTCSNSDCKYCGWKNL